MKSLVIILLVVAWTAFAGDVPVPSGEPIPTGLSAFNKGMREFAVSGAWEHSPALGTTCRSTFDFATGNICLGWMLYSPDGSGRFRGNLEVLANAFGAGVTAGRGRYLTGGRVLLRYNIVQPEARLIPFASLGLGGLANNVYCDQSQRLIGACFEFDVLFNAGVRYFVRPSWALIVDGIFQHISNGGMADRNVGVNSAGLEVGTSVFF